MPTPQLFVETYTVFYGAGPGDPQKKVWADDCATREVAQSLAAQFNDLVARKLISPVTYNGKVAWFEANNRNLIDLAALPAPADAYTPAGLHAFLRGQECSAQVFLRVKDENGTNKYVAFGVATGTQLDAMVT